MHSEYYHADLVVCLHNATLCRQVYLHGGASCDLWGNIHTRPAELGTSFQKKEGPTSK